MNKKIKYFIILGIVIVVCGGFLQMHYSSDTYVLWDLGYENYPQEYFLLDGRLISAFVCFVAGIFNLPLEVYIIGMTVIAMFFVAGAIFLMSEIFLRLNKNKEIIDEIFLTIISFILILNQFTLEYLLFPESAVMCLGLFLIIVAVNIWLNENKNKYFKVFIVLLISTICYQGLLNIFPVLIFLIYILKQINETKKDKLHLKQLIKDLLKLIGILIIVLVIALVIIEIGKNIFDSIVDRTNNISNVNDILNRFSTVFDYLIELWHQNLNMLPRYINYSIIGATILLLIFMKNSRKIILEYIVFIIFTLIICILPMFVFNTGPVGRVNIPLAMIWGSSLIILYFSLNASKITELKNYVYIFIGTSFLINMTFININIAEHLKSNQIEHELGNKINYLIEEYEKENDITITKFGYIYDRYPSQYATGIKHMGSMTEKKLAMPWSIYEAMNFYTNRDLERIYVEEILDTDYDLFLEDHVLFDEDAVYLIVY